MQPVSDPLVLLQSDATQGFLGFVPLLLIFAIFYFFILAPARKRQKAVQALVDALKKGDRVITTGGLYGEVVSVDDQTVILKVADNVKVKMAKSAVGGLESEGVPPGVGR